MRITHRAIASTGLILALFEPALVAQTHPCDQQAPSTQTIQSGAPRFISFCSLATDNVEAAVAYVDGQAYDLLPVTAKTAPSASGYVQYETGTFLQVSRGDHVLEAAAYNRQQLTGLLQLGAKSPPVFFVAVDLTPLPGPPARLIVGR
jgi:hypothetical protein